MRLFGLMQRMKLVPLLRSFSSSSPSCDRNFDPTEMNDSLPTFMGDLPAPPPLNSALSSAFSDSCTSPSRDACSASLFFSMN